MVRRLWAGRRGSPADGTASHLPARAILPPQKRVDVGPVAPHRRRVPGKLPPDAIGDVGQQHTLPDRARDYAHYEEFYSLAIPIPEFAREAGVARHFAEGYAIHYHVWTHESFAEMLEHVDRDVCPWTHVWTHPAVADESRCIEFYAVLVK